ncbi:MAG TPA: nicotinamide riboside transporter PnuC [Chitinophagales bacterium]|nr:nicotinamide riboside transporter PnuC [Chitinophagales bacterium]HRK26403.1 nicotinamide riboside transporter PnuC [Chitinophagales bacterium]
MDIYEIGGLLSGIAYVVLAARASVWCWPIGLVNVLLFIYLNYYAKLYADVGLQFVYLALTLYGWYNWANAAKQQGNHIGFVNRRLFGSLTLLTVCLAALLALILDRYTDTDVPVWDAVVTALSLTATWLTAQKILENWLLWIFTDVLYVGLYAYKELYLLALLFVIYTLVAAQGYLYWKKLARREG